MKFIRKLLRAIFSPVLAVLRFVVRVIAKIDFRDIALWGGWTLMTVGIWRLYGDWGFAVGGAVLLAVGVFGIASTGPPVTTTPPRE